MDGFPSSIAYGRGKTLSAPKKVPRGRVLDARIGASSRVEQDRNTRTMCAIRSGANAMDFRESERVQTSDVAPRELAKNDAPVTPESTGEKKSGRASGGEKEGQK